MFCFFVGDRHRATVEVFLGTLRLFRFLVDADDVLLGSFLKVVSYINCAARRLQVNRVAHELLEVRAFVVVETACLELAQDHNRDVVVENEFV